MRRAFIRTATPTSPKYEKGDRCGEETELSDLQNTVKHGENKKSNRERKFSTVKILKCYCR